MENTDDRIAKAVEQAEEAFWAQMAAHFPEITSGDIHPESQLRLKIAMNNAAKDWVANNI